MRSDRDKISDTEREIDDFLSRFDPPADDEITDLDAYLDDSTEPNVHAEQSFNWKNITSGDIKDKITDDAAPKKEVKETSDTAASGNPNKNTRSGRKNRRSSRSSAQTSDTVSLDMPSLDFEYDNKAAAADQAPEEKADKKENNGRRNKKKRNRRRDYRDIKGNKETVSEPVSEAVPAPAAAAVKDPAPAPKTKITELKDETVAYHKVDHGSRRKRKSYKDTGTFTEKDFAAVRNAAASASDASGGERFHREKASAKKTVEAEKKTSDKPAEENKLKSVFSKKEGKKKESRKKESAKKGGKRNIKEFLFLKKNPAYDPSKGATYEKDGKKIRNVPFRFSFLKLLRDFVLLGAAMAVCGMLVALVMIAFAPKYDYKDVYAAVDTSSVIYDDQNKAVDNVFYTENRKIIKYEDMPEDLINAFVAIEDKTFWKHHGFNWTRMIGAVLSSLTGNGRISGTSTITQQLSRNVYLADIKSVRSIRRKVLEMYYAARLEHALSKEEIIEAYLNTIYLGHGCYGVNAAANTYFSKSVKDLDLVECASLATLPQSPDTYALLKLADEAQDVRDSKVVATDPQTVVTNDIAKDRRQLCLDLMLAQNYIDQAEYDEVYDMSLNDYINPNLTSSSTAYSYFHEYLVDTVIADLQEQLGLSYEDAERMVYTKGLKIYSTVDSKAQKVIAKEFQDGSNFPYISAPTDENGNMMNNDGHINLYKYENYFDDDGDFKLSGKDGDVTVNSDGSITINRDHKLNIYETEVEDGIDYSIEFKAYYLYDDDDILYSISGGYLNIPASYKSADSSGNVIIDKSFFEDPDYEGYLKIDGNDVIITEKAYTLSGKNRQPQAAMTIVGVGTGEVKAMVGGRQFGGQKLLNRSLNPRQPGSSIKPLAVYGAALQKSFELEAAGKKWKFTNFGIDKQGVKGWGDYVTTHSSIEDEKTKINGKYWPENVTRSFSGKNTFKTAINRSINTCAVKLLLQVGADYSIDQLKKFGITTVQDDTSVEVNDANPAALALGAMTEGVMPLEMALAYASFPAGGKLNTPICYYKVEDRNGDVILKGKSEQSESLNEGVAWIMTDVLKGVVSSNGYMYVEDVQPGGKTGTTNDQYDIWFDGFTPSYAAAMWIGTDENVEMSSGSIMCASLWGKIMNQIPACKKGNYSEAPDNVIYTSGCYFTKGTETGLTSWTGKDAKKEAYKKWLKERENHKKKVCESIPYKVKVQDAEYGTREVEKTRTVTVDDPDKPIYDEEDPTKIIGYEQMETTETYTETETYEISPEKYETRYKEKCHWEYEKGWETFSYNG